MADQTEAIDSFTRRKVYVGWYGAGIANRIWEALSDDKMLAIMNSNKSVNEKVRLLNKDLADKKAKSNKVLHKALTDLYGSQIKWFDNLVEDNIDAPKVKVDTVIREGLSKPMAASNGLTAQELYDSTWESASNDFTGYIKTEALVAGTPAAEALMSIPALTDKFQRGLDTASRTAAYATIEATNDRLYKANSDIVRGVMFSAVLDGRTTNFCKSIDGDIVPLSEDLRAPFHPNCRTQNIPVMKDVSDKEAREILEDRTQVRAGEEFERGEDVQDKKPTRSNLRDDKVKVVESKKGASYGDFLAVQSTTPYGKEFIRDVLGVTRGNAFISDVKAGKNPQQSIKSIVNTPARELSLEELNKKK